nr:hypothetical protein [Tanacetum cinerariifolium]
MDNPNILKAHQHGQTFNWETATYGKVMYYKDIDYFKDFEMDFPTIVYKDALVSDHEISSKPTVSPFDDKEINLKISFDESGDEENDNDKNKISSNIVVIEQSDKGIDANVGTQPRKFDEGFETNHDIHRGSFNRKDHFIKIKVMIQKHFHEEMKTD